LLPGVNGPISACQKRKTHAVSEQQETPGHASYRLVTPTPHGAAVSPQCCTVGYRPKAQAALMFLSCRDGKLAKAKRWP
jgi:hypothetical protein